jgi:predicted O-linked N-acetylglucosamine transferase (SPINDLY family)
MSEIRLNLIEAFDLLKKKDFINAKLLYESILAVDQKNFDALFFLAVILINFKNYKKASDLLEQVVLIKPNFADAYNNLGICLEKLNDLDGAIKNYNLAINNRSNFAEAYNNLGVAFQKLKNFDQAILQYKKAINYKSLYLDAYINLANLYKETRQFEEAIKNYDLAINLNPKHAEVYNNKGNALKEIRKFEEAIKNYDLAINLNPKLAEVYNNKGNTLKKIRKFEEAIKNYDLAINLNPNFADAYFNTAKALQDIKNFEKAVLYFEKALSLNKEIPFCKGHLLHAKMLCCNWSGLNELYKEIYNYVEKNRYSATPFGYQVICDDESSLQKCSQLYSSKYFPEIKNNFFTKKISKNKKVKIGYLCGEFREHATSVLMTEVWEKHDKENFEIIAFDSSGWDDKSLRRNRIVAAFDKFIDISKMLDFDAAKLIYKEQIDILINLNGFTGIGKPIVFSYRPAPIQINYLGFPGTIGSKYIDYILCDQTVVPSQSKKFYNEKIIYLPDSYQANDTKRKISEKRFLREELSLPKESFVFCCFNNNYKITPNMFDVWAILLKKIDNSVLWLIEGNSEATKNLKKEFKIRNIDGSRLIFAKRMKLEDHLARHKNADLFLDTLPYNAHTTASDSLWAGLPVLTCLGKAFPGRVAASLLRSLDLPELITYSENEYIAKAEEFALNPEKLRLIKNKLDVNKFSKPLFNTELFCRNLESAFKIVFNKNSLKLETEDISI